MWISRLAKSLLCGYMAALIACTVLSSVSNKVAITAYWLAGGSATSFDAENEPDATVSDIFG